MKKIVQTRHSSTKQLKKKLKYKLHLSLFIKCSSWNKVQHNYTTSLVIFVVLLTTDSFNCIHFAVVCSLFISCQMQFRYFLRYLKNVYRKTERKRDHYLAFSKKKKKNDNYISTCFCVFFVLFYSTKNKTEYRIWYLCEWKTGDHK